MRDEKETFRASQTDPVQREIEEVRQSVELTRSEIRRAKNDFQQYQGAHESHVRRTTILWAVVLLMVVGALGFVWYGSPLLKEHQGLLGKVPVLQSTMDSITARVRDTEQKTSQWANDRAGFSDRMSKMETSVSSNMKAVRNEAQKMSQQIKTDVGQRLQSLQNRVSGVEAIQREHAEEVARLRNDISGVKQELVSVREENVRQATQLKSQIQEVQQAHEVTRNDVSGLNKRLTSNQTKVSALAYQVDRKRVDFELASGKTQQVVDGIYVTVKNTDVERQTVDGWVQIARDGRFVWLRNESAQNPIGFSSREDARTYQIVFTQVGHDKASGYILVPNEKTETASN